MDALVLGEVDEDVDGDKLAEILGDVLGLGEVDDDIDGDNDIDVLATS